MEITLRKPVKYDVKYLKVDAGVRYWEDAIVNGVEDDERHPKIYGASRNRWEIIIDIEQGLIIGWPSNMTATVNYKVCDDGIYTLLDKDMLPVFEKEDYVPSLLEVDENGYGDYINFSVDEDGIIKDWKNRNIQVLVDQFVNEED